MGDDWTHGAVSGIWVTTCDAVDREHVAVSFFPIKAAQDNVEWRINRVDKYNLLLTCVTDDPDAAVVEIAFPLSMVVEMCERIASVKHRLDADTKTALMFRKGVPAWPHDIFDEEKHDAKKD